MIIRTLAIAAILTAAIAPAQAQSVRLLGEFRDWTSYATAEGAGEVCFALSRPKTVAPTPDGFTSSYLYITNRPDEGIKNEFNLVAGYSFAPDTPATVTVGGDSFTLYTEGDAAWLDDAAQADRLASVIRAGSTLVIEGTTDRGIRVTQTFSLSGATAASRAIDGEC